MAITTTTLKLIFTIIILTSTLIITPTASQHHQFSKPLSRKQLNLMSHGEKLAHLHFYFHDIVSGRRPTAVRVASSAATNASATGFGMVVMIDDPLTLSPQKGSRIVGRAQGVYASADMAEIGLLMAVNFVFHEGEFNGSTLSLLGRNEVMSAVREMPIVGGSGVFRFGRGYAQAKTREVNVRTGDAVVEYNVYVFHY